MKCASAFAVALHIACVVRVDAQKAPANPAPLSIRSATGLELRVAESIDPALRIRFTSHPSLDSAIHVLFPEHVTAVRRGTSDGQQLYVFRPDRRGARPVWRVAGRALEYEKDLSRGVHLLARATLEDDGVRFRYELTNRSSDAFDMITAVTDPRLASLFLDKRLERTFVHHADGFDLLASETPARLTAPLDEWLPARYLASFRWPVPDRRVDQRGDGITYYNKSRAVDEPFIATRSSDGEWVVASFTRATGNVWSNPKLTCQHVDPQTSLGPGDRAILEIKMLIVRASLDDALRMARAQRRAMQ